MEHPLDPVFSFVCSKVGLNNGINNFWKASPTLIPAFAEDSINGILYFSACLLPSTSVTSLSFKSHLFPTKTIGNESPFSLLINSINSSVSSNECLSIRLKRTIAACLDSRFLILEVSSSSLC
jgi:hypothetical protein